jgi:hopanoid biosynthesis associated protein HpnK
MKQVILNADDFGLTRGVNEGIIRAHRDGILTSATLMANGAAFDDAVEKARATPSLGVGCHLVLVGGKSVAPPDKIPSLADADGRLPRTLANLVTRLSLGLIRQSHIERELAAQVEKVQAAGIEPTHFDSHKHSHCHPRVMEAAGKLAHDTGVGRLRNPTERIQDFWETARGVTDSFGAKLVMCVAARSVAPLFRAVCRKYSLRAPDRFLGVALTGYTTPQKLRQMFGMLTEGSTEIMLHPGIRDEDLARTGSRLQQARQNEMDALLDQQLKGVLSERDIRLISFRELH